MNKYVIKIREFGRDILEEVKAGSRFEAESIIRENLSYEFGCAPEDLKVISITKKIQTGKKPVFYFEKMKRSCFYPFNDKIKASLKKERKRFL